MTSKQTCKASSTSASSSSTEKKAEVETEIHELNTIVYATDTTPSMIPRNSRINNRMIAPFIAAHDIPRGVIHAVQALLGYILMLAIMYAHPFSSFSCVTTRSHSSSGRSKQHISYRLFLVLVLVRSCSAGWGALERTEDYAHWLSLRISVIL